MDENNQLLAAELACYKSMKELRRSGAFRRNQSVLRKLFDLPRTYFEQSATPRLTSFLRVAAWNIECGKRFDGIVHALTTHPVLRFADVVLLNEVDDGMARSANRLVARDLGREIGAHAIYGVEYLEISNPADASAAQQTNTAALHGNAILTRHAFNRPRLIRLPRCEKNFESPQKRLGGRVGLVVDLDFASGLVAATTHLDVVNAPRCRQRQLGALLAYLDSDSRAQAVLGGDFNTHTFSRGTSLGEARSLARLLVSPDAVVKSLLSPFLFEPALQDLARFGFGLQGFNDQLETCRVGDSQLLKSSALPGPLKELVRRRFGSRPRSLDFRLDWLAGRGVKPLADGEMVDTATGIPSISAQTLQGLEYQGCPISDHNPIVADIIAAPSK